MENQNGEEYFSKVINKRERACFEIGIKLGALYHILCGIPISSNPNVISSIQEGIASAISCQPYVKQVKIDLNTTHIKGEKKDQYDYDEITGKIIRAMIEVEYERVKVIAKVDWKKSLEYPLMFIESIEELD
ncbi:MAG: hypothetical protein GF317_19290 [Candidatus Lokiarchaeota archaeon]|nr:hypothetical protein [Candidatus Lokiarchaeota archaeon]MBD3201643.1 hypothetical protein [Candidatus Lokiarchaeota archaeon]